MADRFVTVATCANPVEASQCRALLEEAGLRVILSGEETSSVLGLPAAEWAGVQLAVPEESVEQALQLLAGEDDPGEGRDEAPALPDAITTAGGQGIATAETWDRGGVGRPPAPPVGAVTDLLPDPADREGDREEEPDAPMYLSRREERADHIITLTFVCWLFPPFLVAPFVMLLRIWCSSEPMRPRYFGYTYLAAALNPIFWVLVFILLDFLGVL